MAPPWLFAGKFMAARKKKPSSNSEISLKLVPSAAAATAVDEELEEFDELEGGELSRAIDEMRSSTGVQVEVYRLMPERGFCANYPVALFSNEKVAEDWGPGKYRVRFKGDDNRYLRGGGTIDIATPRRAAVTLQSSAGGGVQDMLAVLRADREKDKAGWMEWAKLLAPLLAPKLLEMLSPSKQPTLTELMAVINGAKEFHKPEPAPSVADQFEQFANLLDLAQKMGGGGKDSTGATWVDLIRDGINKVPDVLAAVKGGIPLTGPLLPAPDQNPLLPQPMLAPTIPASSATATPAGASSPVPRREGDMDLRMLPWLKHTLEQLLVQAQNDRDPDMYAAVTVDNLPNYVAPADMVKFLNRPDWWQTACSIDGRLAAYPGWFQAFHQALVGILADEPPTLPPQPMNNNEGGGEEFT